MEKGVLDILVEHFLDKKLESAMKQDDKFKDKALVDAVYVLDEALVNRRKAQDMDVPDAEDSIFGEDIGIDDETELKQYVESAYEAAVNKIEEVEAMPLAEEAKNEAEAQDWWLGEQAFDVHEVAETKNPFGKNKSVK